MKQFILKAISIYQRIRLPHLPTCRFQPTCSAYTYQAVSKYGTIRGMFLGVRRILKCHPWSAGGFDPVI